ncbi:MAG: peptide chain release factor N(5)-glutamine methyltransferase [Maribacter sp.]|nr:peptide chain release factor N(5)-glutamine methyltransferase [Maribacter sp.]
MLLREIKNIFHSELGDQYPNEEIDSFFYLLIGHYLGLERFVLAITPDLRISKKEEQPLFEALANLKLNRPLQYIVGKAHFMEMDFKVNEKVLIPRPETEELVRWIIDDTKKEQGDNPTEGKENSRVRILDIGTGSGCIAIALAKNLSMSNVCAMDISGDALQIAERNAQLNGVEIELIQADILAPGAFAVKFDIIVSNPPYVRESERREMAKNVKDYEPREALFVPNDNPLMYYKAIIDFASRNLKADGVLYLEINQYLANETRELLQKSGFKGIELKRDLFGNDRMLKGKMQRALKRQHTIQ